MSLKHDRSSPMSSYYGGNHQNNHQQHHQHNNHVISSSSSPKQHTTNGKYNGRQRASSSPTHHAPSHREQQSTQYYGKKEKGVIEKLLNSYGFIECSTTSNRVFFHYSEYDGDPNNLVVGDCLEFVLTTDPRNNKPIAIKLSKLPSGSVVVETITDETCIGCIEVEAKHPKNGEAPDPSTFGRVSYDKNGEFFFLPFSIHDIAKGEHIKKGDNVEFSVATNKRTGSLKARKIRFLDPSKSTSVVHGIVSSLKESFGFIERADVVAEIFFHYTEYSGNISDLTIGDDVQFQLQNRLGKEIAVSIKKLDPGSVVFEDISETRYRGHVIKAVSQKNMNNSLDGHLTGMIEYQGKSDTHEVLFGDRDMEDDIILQKGDVVEFNVSTDRRDKLQRAVNIKLISVCVKNGQSRDVGVVSSLKDGFGFIRCAEQDLSIFFHFSEVLEQSHIINIGDDVEFTIENDNISQRQHATRIRFLPKGSVSFETISKKRHVGVVHQEAPERNTKSPSKHHNRENDHGIIKCFLEGREEEIQYRTRDCRPRDVPRYRDKVEFLLVTKKANQQLFARDLTVTERSEVEQCTGFVCALKDSYGFIESLDHVDEYFFHYSELDGHANQLELGDCVRFTESRKSEKRSAENVTCLLSYNSPDEVLQPSYEGVVTRPMRTMDPDQEEYEGLIQLCQNGTSNHHHHQKQINGDEKHATMNEEQQLVYRYGITSLLEKKDAIQAGDKVTFQVCIDHVTKKKRAANVVCKRSLLQGKIESMKGQFGFISYDTGDGKSVFFHMSEVQNDHGKELKIGDEVRFIIVQNHKNAKKSAIRVKKIVDERPEHLTRRRSNKLSESQASKFQVLRQPTGPDGSNGFKLHRGNAEESVVVLAQNEEQLASLTIEEEQSSK